MTPTAISFIFSSLVIFGLGSELSRIGILLALRFLAHFVQKGSAGLAALSPAPGLAGLTGFSFFSFTGLNFLGFMALRAFRAVFNSYGSRRLAKWTLPQHQEYVA